MFSPPVVAFDRNADTAVFSTSCIVRSRLAAFFVLRLRRRHARQRGSSVPSRLFLKCSSVAGKAPPQSWQTLSVIYPLEGPT